MDARHKKRLITVLAVCLTALCALLFFLRYHYVNSQYPPRELRTYAVGEPAPFDGATIQTRGGTFMTDEELHRYFEEELPYGNIHECLVAEVRLENPTENAVDLDLTIIVMETQANDNGIALTAYLELNPDTPTLHPTLEPGERLDIRLPYTLSKNWFSKQTWSRVRELDYHLVISLYPTKQELTIL